MDNVRQQVHHRLGRNLDNQDKASLRQAMYVLTQQTGIYKMSAMDSYSSQSAEHCQALGIIRVRIFS